jgi:hypothetical protein
MPLTMKAYLMIGRQDILCVTGARVLIKTNPRSVFEANFGR